MVAVKLERGCRLQSGGSIPDCQPVVGPSAAGRRQEWHASAGNRARVTSMATMYSTTRPLMLLGELSTPCSSSLAERTLLQSMSPSTQARMSPSSLAGMIATSHPKGLLLEFFLVARPMSRGFHHQGSKTKQIGKVLPLL